MAMEPARSTAAPCKPLPVSDILPGLREAHPAWSTLTGPSPGPGTRGICLGRFSHSAPMRRVLTLLTPCAGEVTDTRRLPCPGAGPKGFGEALAASDLAQLETKIWEGPAVWIMAEHS